MEEATRQPGLLEAIEPGLAAFIRALPKAELHLHLDGALPWARLRELHPELPPAPPFWAPAHRYRDFGEFVDEVATYGSLWLTSPERYGETLSAMLVEAAQQNVRYLETSIHLQKAVTVAPAAEILSVLRGVARDAPGIEVRLFVGLCRDDGERFAREIDALLACDDLDGLDLHGFESIAMQDWTPRVWQRARELGKFTKAHAGELGPAAHVREAVERLDVRRIEHGVRSVEDPELVALLRDRGVTLDVCPLSNLKLRIVPDIASHPIAALHRAGVACTVNTDDPFFFGNRLHEDYAVLATELGFSRADLAALAANGLRAALVPEAWRARQLAEIAALAGAA